MLLNRGGVPLNMKLIEEALLQSPRGNQHIVSDMWNIETEVFFSFTLSHLFNPSTLDGKERHPHTHTVLNVTVLPMPHSTEQSCNCLTLSPSTWTVTIIQPTHYTGLGGACHNCFLTCIIQWHCSTVEHWRKIPEPNLCPLSYWVGYMTLMSFSTY